MIFHYVKTQRSKTIKILVNILLIPVILYFFHSLAENKANFEEVYVVVEKAAIVVMVILTGLLIWHLMSNDKFEIYVSKDEFYSHHPLFKEWCFSLNPKNINEIKNELIMLSSGSMSNINVYMKNGQKVQICQNYNFSLNELYTALHKVNPEIKLPDNANVFKH